MSEVAQAEATEAAVPEMSDEQMDQYFEKQGEIDLDTPAETAETKEVIESSEEKSSVQEPKQEDPRTVPLAALHEERRKRQEQDRKLQLLEERLSQIAQPKEEPEPEIDVNENPVEYFKRQNDKLQQQLEQVTQGQQEQFQHQQQQAQVTQFKQAYASAAQEFSKQQPDFGDAYTHLVTGRMKELTAVGYTEQQAAMIAQNDEAAFVAKAFQDGVNPAERVYQFAVARGYAPSQDKPADKKPAEQVDLDAIEKGVKQKSVSSMSGSPTENITLEALAEMSDEDFEKAVKNGTFDRLQR